MLTFFPDKPEDEIISVKNKLSLKKYVEVIVNNMLYISGSLSILSAVVVMYYPGLKLPDSRSFQLFQSSQLLEQYDLVYRDNYWFERSNRVSVILINYRD